MQTNKNKDKENIFFLFLDPIKIDLARTYKKTQGSCISSLRIV